jgi:hypothetical protein
LTGLIVLNGVLLLALGAVKWAPQSMAQGRSRDVYTMVAGSINGQNAQVVYVVNETTQELVAVLWDDSKRVLTGMGFRNLSADANELQRSRN